ncbi:hypothetical protein RIF29_30563 [Crotalaria pallida]|uniref:Neprosin PEP catalytic domain-containing protein n=1 Tax=Crotalaria pallida TaxID=3830 RepID=A0AAN9EGK0_CROPI
MIINILLISLSLCLVTNNYIVDGRMASISQGENLELEKQLKLINKPPTKTIQTSFGHIVDCIDINKQLAFDNPLLKNHKIQLQPSFQVARTTINEGQRSARLSSSIGIEKVSCPRGTVPARRRKKDDLIHAKQLSKITGMLTKDIPGSYGAAVKLNPGGTYYGIKGIIDTYNPIVASKEQMTGAFIYLSNGPPDVANSIITGWQDTDEVYPEIHGDIKTHFFIAWADKNTSAGCYNLQCPGFVQTDKSIYIDSPVINTSTYDGPQFDISLSIYLDPTTNNWWVRLQETDLGYFPAALFSDMSSANEGGWYGKTMTVVGNPSPPMGSGHLPDNNIRHSCYIRQMAFQDQSRGDIGPEFQLVSIYRDNPSCYDVQYDGYEDKSLGYAMLFGGPGGYCGN